MKLKQLNPHRIQAQRRRAFTLVELLLVLVILGILAAIVIPKFSGRTEQAKEQAAVTQISTFRTALDAFEVDCGRYPTSEEGIRALLEPPSNADGWKGPYLKKGVPKDPWGNDYVYLSPGSHGDCDIISYGSDGQAGGEGNDKDVDNWDIEK